MSTIKNDLLNELRNEKYYLDNDFVRVANDQSISYREKIDKVNSIASRIASIVQTIDIIDKYIPNQEAPAPAPVSQPPTTTAYNEQPEGDVVSADAPVEVEHKIEGQTHAE